MDKKNSVKTRKYDQNCRWFLNLNMQATPIWTNSKLDPFSYYFLEIAVLPTLKYTIFVFITT